jgi:threonine/homoserine/homoserine lactone efflux protein
MMSASVGLSYFITVVAIALAPGPCALVLVVRSASRDLRGAFGFGLGYAIGTVIIITAVCFGLGLWLSSVPAFFEYSKYLMLAYILWLAYGIWNGSVALDGSGKPAQNGIFGSVAAGVLTCFISPYMMILFPLVLPELVNITEIALPDFAMAASLTFAAISAGSMILIIFASQIGRLVRSERSLRILNRSLASLLTCAGTWMAFG